MAAESRHEAKGVFMQEREAEHYRFLKSIRETGLSQRGVGILDVLLRDYAQSAKRAVLVSLLAFPADLERSLSTDTVRTWCQEARIGGVSPADVPAVRRAILGKLFDFSQTKNLVHIAEEIAAAEEAGQQTESRRSA
jgi:hypothetical protein